ncbi:SDR family oxidoreductase [Kribbella sp. NPDC051586]|uniref:SDR family oxidoreductase n=1 Tax=Kribbella sp. NPDC051586 TaxID=3364118 RepID=UPI003791F513
MTKVAVLGASGRIARHAVQMLAEDDSFEQTLFVRDADRLTDTPGTIRVVQGDVLDRKSLDDAIRGQDVVYANLAGDVDEQARTIIQSMNAAGPARLVFISALGIYDEVPGKFGQWNRDAIGPMVGPYRAAADAIESSDLDYTILRPAWLTDTDEINFEVTEKGEPFRGTEVSRKSVAALVVEILKQPSLGSRKSLGINKPGTDGDRPAFA